MKVVSMFMRWSFVGNDILGSGGLRSLLGLDYGRRIEDGKRWLGMGFGGSWLLLQGYGGDDEER